MAPLPTKVVNWRQRARVGMHRLHGKRGRRSALDSRKQCAGKQKQIKSLLQAIMERAAFYAQNVLNCENATKQAHVGNASKAINIFSPPASPHPKYSAAFCQTGLPSMKAEICWTKSRNMQQKGASTTITMKPAII